MGVAAALLLLSALATTADASPTYRAIPGGAGAVARLREARGTSGLLDVLRVNRRDARHAVSADTLLVPDGELASLELAPFPRSVPAIDSVPKMILVSMRVQAFAAYERGALVRWGPICSGGSSSPSRQGRYHANWKARTHRSSVNEDWIMPFTVNIDDQVGTALHEYDLPGRPASHCCIRLLHEDAAWVYDWVETPTASGPGTPVLLFGEYDFLAPPPWRRLAADPSATRVTEEEIASALEAAS